MQLERILVVDDDPDIRELLSDYLSQAHYDVATAGNGIEMTRVLAERDTDLVILDLMLPGDDGFSLCRQLSEQSSAAVIMLSARDTQVDRIVGLELGADDYITKPFDPRELLARVKAVLRRASGARAKNAGASGHSAKSGNGTPEYITFAGWELDMRARQMRSPVGLVISLPSSDFHVLRCLLAQPNQALSRDYLMTEAFSRERLPMDRAIDVCVSRLRQHLDADNDRAPLIRTVRNEGYMLYIDSVVRR
ncbi:response regulator [Pigmentiphaga aceris]|nr:response regulator [Pigmentiphaga aceris]